MASTPSTSPNTTNTLVSEHNEVSELMEELRSYFKQVQTTRWAYVVVHWWAVSPSVIAKYVVVC
jgi:hypothetical protein